MKYLITVFSNPRSGTNYFTNLLDNGFPYINGNYEMFNPTQCFCNIENLDNLKKNLNLDSKSLSIYSRAYPIELIDKLFTLIHESIIAHKLFNKHFLFRSRVIKL